MRKAREEEPAKHAKKLRAARVAFSVSSLHRTVVIRVIITEGSSGIEPSTVG
jgi:hypothetical protein